MLVKLPPNDIPWRVIQDGKKSWELSARQTIYCVYKRQEHYFSSSSSFLLLFKTHIVILINVTETSLPCAIVKLVPPKYGMPLRSLDSRTCYGCVCILCLCGVCHEIHLFLCFFLSFCYICSCGQWILFRNSVSQLEDCQAVAELYDECAPCNPLTCGPNETAVPSLAPMPIANSPQPTTVNGTIPSDKPQTSQPTFAPFGVTNPDAPCGCFACDETVLSTVVLGFSCQDRIDYLQTNAGGNLGYLESCKQVAESFDNNICGPAW